MTGTSGEGTAYSKADSILALRPREAAREEAVLERVRALNARLGPAVEAAGGRTAIVRRACADLLSPGPETAFRLRPHVVEEMARLHDHELERYLHYRYRYETYPTARILDDSPPCVQIEPTSICNYRCVFCYQTDPELTGRRKGHMGMMDLGLFRRVLDQIEGHVEAVTLASRGEPLACPDFAAMMEALSGRFIATKVNTNASLLDEAKAHAILSADIQTLVISADAADERRYAELRVNGRLSRVVANVERFRAIQEKHYPGSRLITRVSGVKVGAGQDLEAIERFWGRLVDQVAFVDYNPWERVYESPPNGIGAPCSDLWRRLFVWWDGRVNPCDVDYRSTLAVGSLADGTLRSLWRGPAYEALRRPHRDGRRQELRPCSGCCVV